jgi:hypothetical protein
VTRLLGGASVDSGSDIFTGRVPEMAGRRQTAQTQSTSQPASESSSGSTSSQTVERRRRMALRALVEEMLTEIRSAASAAEENWTPEERQRAEADLARIMDQVRREAFRNSPAE